MKVRKRGNTSECINKRSIIVETDYGYIKIVNLKSVWINRYLGAIRLMYEDDNYSYNYIYWGPQDSMKRYINMKEKLIDAYNRGDVIVQI